LQNARAPGGGRGEQRLDLGAQGAAGGEQDVGAVDAEGAQGHRGAQFVGAAARFVVHEGGLVGEERGEGGELFAGGPSAGAGDEGAGAVDEDEGVEAAGEAGVGELQVQRGDGVVAPAEAAVVRGGRHGALYDEVCGPAGTTFGRGCGGRSFLSVTLGPAVC
jgi:hypothetical protein